MQVLQSRVAVLDPARRWTPSCHRHRLRSSTAVQSEATERPAVVKTIPQRRQATPAPEAIAVEHSPAFLLRNRQPVQPSISARRSVAEDDVNPVKRVLQRVDRSLDELEAEASPLVEAVWAVSNSPIAHVTGKGVTAAAQVGKEAVLMAIPVGQWALKRGFSLALGAIAAGDSRSRSARKPRSLRKAVGESADESNL